MGRIFRKLRRLSLRSVNRNDQALEGGSRVENTDALSAATGGPGMTQPQGGLGHSGAPPGYVKPDDGRPRH